MQHADDKISELKAEQKKNKEKETEKGGEITTWAIDWLHTNAVTSQVFHGGDWQGNSCRAFLRNKAKGDDSSDEIYIAFINNLTKKIQEISADTQAKKKAQENLITFLNGVFRSICTKLAPVISALSSTDTFSDEQCDNAADACKEYVRFYREQLSTIRKTIDGVNVKPKMHVLETHVPEWLSEWRSVGFFGEDVVESLHAVVNKLQRVQSSSFARDKRKYIQTVDGELNLLFAQFASAQGKHHEEPKKKKRKKGGEGSSLATPAATAANGVD